jgi:DNA repair exonuclease SbcCD ATPase subunit
MLKLKDLTVKNFMSVGNATQAINFDRKDLTLVLGENLDLGGDDSGARNGTGKTTILNGLSYAMFGAALTNIKKDNLINKTNQKNMLVTVDFEKDGTSYRIERGRKPAIMKFWINDEEKEITDEAQGDSRETQGEIEKILGMSHDMFKHIVALNTYTEPFLALKANDQRNIIEQLLGITILSEKSDKLKEVIKLTKEGITSEEHRITAVTDANKRIEDQIENLKRRQTQWIQKHDKDLSDLVNEYDNLSRVDIEAELQEHKMLTIYKQTKEKIDRRNALVIKQAEWKKKIDKDIETLQKKYDQLNTINLDEELQLHKDLAIYNQKKKEIDDLNQWIEKCDAFEDKETKKQEKLKKEIELLENHTCHSCGQQFHDDKQEQLLSEKRDSLKEGALSLLSNNTQYLEHSTRLDELGALGTKPTPYYKSEIDAVKHMSELSNILQQIEAKLTDHDPYADQLAEMKEYVLGVKPETMYSTEADAINHRNRVETLLTQIDLKSKELDPYKDQIADMETNGLVTVSYAEINDLMSIKEHQEFLLKLLTNKDSFIRKQIIDQNLSYLNSRLSHYLDKIGLPHTIKFNNDLSVTIEELGRDLDFDNLSRGERNRLILSLSWSFRDVWESLYQPINLLFIDELVDSGMDTSGVENAMSILKKMSREQDKSIWLVSHKDELASRVNNTLKVIKENGYTRYDTDVSIV